MQIFNCSVSKGIHRGFNRPDDAICVFINYKQVGKFKEKSAAIDLVKKLITNCPNEARKDFEAHQNELLDVIK